MEHSVQAYLERQSTQVLQVLLRRLLQEKDLDRDMILLILQTLEKRDMENPEEDNPEVNRLLEQFREELLQEGYRV